MWRHSLWHELWHHHTPNSNNISKVSFLAYSSSCRFPRFLKTNQKGFKVHIKTQLLTPSIRYTVNLVLRKEYFSNKQQYVALKYKLEGETETSIVYLANETKDNHSFIAELYQFTSNGRTFDLEIVLEDHKDDLEVEGILFQPLEKVEHEQATEDEELSNDSLQWKIIKEEEKSTNILKWFKKGHKLLDNGQEGYAVDNSGKKSVMFSARGVISWEPSFQSSPESRFGEVVVVNNCELRIEKQIMSNVLSPKTRYATYLIYKLPQEQFKFNSLLKITTNHARRGFEYPYIYLVSPETPTIGQKLDQNTPKYNPLNRHKVYAVPRERKDGWMEVKVSRFQNPSFTRIIHIDVQLRTPDMNDIGGLIIKSIEIRPISLGEGVIAISE